MPPPKKSKQSKTGGLVVRKARAGETALKWRGDCMAAMAVKEHEWIISGPADTGKTYCCCFKAHLICYAVPGVQGAICRKTYSSMPGSVLQTFWRIAKPQGVQLIGGEYPQKYVYPNGSVIWVGGLDNPDKVLSTERDFVYVNQAEELAESDWETLATRCSGRAAVVEYPQLFGDCNPGGSKHWIRRRAEQGRLRLLVTTHRDNPTIYDDDGNVTDSGKARLAVLDNLSGVRRARLKEGVWATAEGAVYSMFNAQVHVRPRNRSEMKRFFLAVDFGYAEGHPAVVLDIGEDAYGRQHCFREFFKELVIPEDHDAKIIEWWSQPMLPDNFVDGYSIVNGQQVPAKVPAYMYEICACDNADPGRIAGLKGKGVNTIGAKGTIDDGIALVSNKLKLQPVTSPAFPDGTPNYTIDPSCVNHINEFESYIFKKETGVPIKQDDHSLDAYRYLLVALAVPSGAITPATASGLATGPATTGRSWGQPRSWGGR